MTASRLFLTIILTIGLLATPLAVDAQSAGKLPLIGILRPGSPPDPLLDAFRQGLRELGYDEGRNINIEYRWAEGRDERFPGLAADLVRLKVDVIVAGAGAAEAAKHATTTIPIVMPVSGDPVRAGLVASLARPGGNITGLTSISPELDGKRLEILKETVPGVSRVASLWEVSATWPRYEETGFDIAARALGLRVLPVSVRSVDELPGAFETAVRERANATFVDNGPLLATHRARVAELAIKHRLPWVAQDRMYPVAGALMSYGTDWDDLVRRSAFYVDRILKGAKPADLPVEQPTKFELVLNMKTAKALGLTIPPSVLARADEVIE
jgi:ABC-type uncharacterized transport system substrate-binding protein